MAGDGTTGDDPSRRGRGQVLTVSVTRGLLLEAATDSSATAHTLLKTTSIAFTMGNSNSSAVTKP